MEAYMNHGVIHVDGAVLGVIRVIEDVTNDIANHLETWKDKMTRQEE